MTVPTEPTPAGARVVEEYIEPGKTATSKEKRPALQAMLERIRTPVPGPPGRTL